MATVVQLVEDVAEIMGEPWETVNSYARALLNAGILPISSGRAIAKVGAADIVALFTAVCLQPKIKDAASEVAKYLNMAVTDTNQNHPENINAGTWLAYLVKIIRTQAVGDDALEARQAAVDQKIVFVRNWPEIRIENDSGMIALFKIGSAGFWEGYHQQTAVLHCRAILMLGLEKGHDYVEAEA